MKKILMLGFIALGLLSLTACLEKSSSNNMHSSQSQVPSNTLPDNDDHKDGEDDNNIANCEASAHPIDEFIRVQTHYGLLVSQPHITTETGGLLPLILTADASEGDLTLQLDSTISLVAGQLLTYHAKNFNYYVAKISGISGNSITLDTRTPITSGISKGQNLWNFYRNPTHPNTVGFNALADYSYRTVSRTIEANSTHVLLGDSWFDTPGFAERIAFHFPDANIINRGRGGDTLCDLLNRFDTDVPSSSPKYVWINSSINDYYDDVTQEVFKVRLQDLISKVQAIGATAIVLDSAPLNNGSTSDGISYLTLSQRYATQLWNLYNESLSQD